jgi:hypothetical protein
MCIIEYTYMSRPKPKVLLEHTSKKNFKTDQILEAEAIWAVFYKGRPFNLKSFSSMISYPGPKYKKVAFSNPGHAINLAKKLNLQFDCRDFTVVVLNSGQTLKNE